MPRAFAKADAFYKQIYFVSLAEAWHATCDFLSAYGHCLGRHAAPKQGGFMKALFLLIPFLAPLLAQADFQPGRERTSATAVLDVSMGTGMYSEVRHAKVEEKTTDGRGITGYWLSLDGRPYFFRVQRASPYGCGDRTIGEAVDPNGRYELTLTNLANCEPRTDKLWTVEVRLLTQEPSESSYLLLEGTPEYIFLTQ